MLDYRSQLPGVLPGIGAFDNDARELDQAGLIRLVKSCALFDDLRANTRYQQPGIRERMDGEWMLAYLAFVNSVVPDIKPWWRESNAEVWWEAGFTKRPDYEIVYKRFRELDENDAAEELFEASAKLIRLAHVCSGGLVGLDVIFDFTEAESHATIKHDCRSGEGCPGFPNTHTARQRGNARYRRASIETVQEDRRDRSKTEPDDEDAPVIGDAQEMRYDAARDVVRIRLNGHWYRLTDKTAGVRAYSGPRRGAKFWVGFYNGKATCHFAGLPLTIIAQSASVQEYNLYPLMVERLERILGRFRSARGDMGLGVKSVYQHNNERGIFSVIPVRGSKQEPKPADREYADRHGIQRCENCGGPTTFISFARSPKPRVFFECKIKPYAECHGKQSMLSEDDPRFALPLRQDTALYQALETQTFQYERVHRFARQRNGSGANSTTTRPKRKGSAWQQLRADATVLSDWTKACFRQGWLPIAGATQRNTKEPVAVGGKEGLEGLTARRVDLNLHVPYGYRARWLGKGPIRHPQPDDVTLAAPDITAPAPTRGQRQARGGRPRPLTALPDVLPPLRKGVIEGAPQPAAASKTAKRAAKKTPAKKASSSAPTPTPAPRPSTASATSTQPLSPRTVVGRGGRTHRIRPQGTPRQAPGSGPAPPPSGAGPPDDDVPF